MGFETAVRQEIEHRIQNTEYRIRILDYGDEMDLKALRRIYSDEKIIHVVKTRKGLSPRTRRFWSLYFHIPPEEITCSKM
jgi:hypothetical protein